VRETASGDCGAEVLDGRSIAEEGIEVSRMAGLNLLVCSQRPSLHFLGKIF
jgi:hypothetical protein